MRFFETPLEPAHSNSNSFNILLFYYLLPVNIPMVNCVAQIYFRIVGDLNKLLPWEKIETYQIFEKLFT